MAGLYQRVCKANLGGILVETIGGKGLRQSFKADHTEGSNPNTLEYMVYNLSADSRARLSEDKDLAVQIEAGYDNDQTDVIFFGGIERVSQVREGADWITRLESTDGGKELRQSKVSISFKDGARLLDMIKQVGRGMLTDAGNIEELTQGDFGRTIQEYANGDALFGRAKDVLDRLCTAGGLDWRVQDGALEITKAGQPYGTDAVRLSPGSGLIGSPEPGEEGKLRATALIQPGLKPRRQVKIESEALSGFYVVSTVSYTGDTHGQDWYAALETVPS